MRYLQASIGRNVGYSEHPMSDRRWEVFKSAMAATMEEYTGCFPTLAEGTDNKGEHFCHLSIWADHLPNPDNLIRTIRKIGATYGQAEIALVIGEAELLPSLTDREAARRERGRHALLA